MTIRLRPLTITRVMAWIVFLLALSHGLQAFLAFKGGRDFVDFLDFDVEANLPSIYSAFAIAFCAVLLFFIAADKRRKKAPGRIQWTLLGFIFLFLALDEATGIHEKIGSMVQRSLETEGLLYFAWVIPYGILVVVLGFAFLTFLLHLPKGTRIQFVVAAVLFLSGALVLEVFSAWEADINGTHTRRYTILYTFEEILEMVAIVVFANALMKYIAREIESVTIRFGGEQKSA